MEVDRTFETSIGAKGEWTYQHIVPVRIGAIGEPSRLFVFEIPPGSGVGTVGITTIRIVWGEVGGSTTDIWSEELSGTVLELSAELDVVLPETGVLFLKFTNTVQRAHFIVGKAHGCLEPSDRLFELGKKGGCKRKQIRGSIEWRKGDTCST